MRVADRPRRIAARLGCLPLSVLAFATAAEAETRIVPAVSLGVARTDNVALSPDRPQHDTVFQLVPTIDISHQSARLDADAAYRLEGYYYRERSDDELYHLFDGNLQVTLDPENLFLDVGGSRNQAIHSPDAAIPPGDFPGNLYIEANRVEREVHYLGPVLTYPVGDKATVNGSYLRRWIRYHDDIIGRGLSEENYLDLSVDNYRGGRGLTWAVRYNAEETETQLDLPWERRLARVELGGWVTTGLRLFAAGGKESAWDRPFDSSLRDRFWEAGLSQTIRDRFTAELAAGKRSYGTSLRGALGITFRRGTSRLSYSERPTLQGRNLFQRGNLLELPQDEIEDLLSQPGVSQRYVQNRLQWEFGIGLRRTNINARVYEERREQRFSVEGVPLPDQVQQGANVGMGWQLTARTAFDIGIGRLRREPGNGVAREFSTFSFDVNHTLGPRTSMIVGYMYAEDEPIDEAIIVADPGYQANVIYALITRTFGL